jgi:hypothetical protein
MKRGRFQLLPNNPEKAERPSGKFDTSTAQPYFAPSDAAPLQADYARAVVEHEIETIGLAEPRCRQFAYEPTNGLYGDPNIRRRQTTTPIPR